MTEIEKVKEKIQKLMALQEGATKIGSFNEAANAAEKVQILLMKHNLELGDIGEKQETLNLSHLRFSMEDIGYNPKQSTWVIILLRDTARLNLCRIITHTNGNKFIGATILGSAINIELSKYLYNQLYNKVKALESKEWADYRGDNLRGKFKRGFYMGAALAIEGKIETIIFNMKHGHVQDIDGEACTALVVRNEAQLQTYTAQVFPHLVPGKKIKHNHSDGVELGRIRGREVSINKGIN